MKQKLKKSFKGSKSRCLYTNSLSISINILFYDIYETFLNKTNSLLNFFLIISFVQLRTSECVLKVWSTNFDTHSSFNLLVMLILSLDSQFFHWLRSKQSSNLCHYRSVETLNDDSISYLQHTVDQNNIDGGSMPVNNLDFEHCALELIPLEKLGFVVLLTHVGHVDHQIWQTLSRDSRGGHK